MRIMHFEIEFFSDWHCGSGLAAGADVDALVIKDKDGFPYVPGKTIKGLVREAFETVNLAAEDQIKKTFGFSGDTEEDDPKGELFFENAELEPNLKETIKKQQTTRYLFRNIASTAIGENGIAKEHSLRRLQVVVPCTLKGAIHDVPDEVITQLENSLAFIKRIGLNRNRGLGRCRFRPIHTSRKEENI